MSFKLIRRCCLIILIFIFRSEQPGSFYAAGYNRRKCAHRQGLQHQPQSKPAVVTGFRNIVRRFVGRDIRIERHGVVHQDAAIVAQVQVYRHIFYIIVCIAADGRHNVT